MGVDLLCDIGCRCDRWHDSTFVVQVHAEDCEGPDVVRTAVGGR